MVTLGDSEFPDALFYDIENQIWYAPLPDGTVRTGFTAWSAKLMGDVLVFTPKRIGQLTSRRTARSRWSKAANGWDRRGAALRRHRGGAQ